MKAKDFPQYYSTYHLTDEYKRKANILEAAKRGSKIATALIEAKK